MALDVDRPDPPDLTNRGLPDALEDVDAVTSESDLHREELEGLLRDGAWTEAFDEWAEYTDLSDAAFRAAQTAGLVDALDFYWDPVDERLRFVVPPVPADLPDERENGSLLRTELTDLGQTVLDTLEDGYVDWGGQSTADTWSDETFDDDAEPDD